MSPSSEVMLLGYSQELSGEYVCHIAWSPYYWPWYVRTLKRTFREHYQLVEYMHRFERRWYELHGRHK